MIGYSEVSAFTDTPGQGNQAGVVLDAAGLSEAQMQELAAFLDVPETVFVTRRGATLPGQPGLVPGLLQVRYFTPTQEVAFCGHATVALGLMLAQAGQWPERGQGVLHLETLAGRVPLRLECEAGVPRRVWMQQPALEWRPVERRWHAQLAEALGISDRLIHRGLTLASASTGLWSVFVPLLDSVLLDSLEPDPAQLLALSGALDVSCIYVYAPLGVGRFAARNFAPALGVPEDPVTGSAAGALLGLLAAQGQLPLRSGRASGVIFQGHALGTPGQVEVEVELEGASGQIRSGQVRAVHVGGCAVLDREGYWQED